MSLDPRAWRPSPLLPQARGAGIMGLFLFVAVMSLAAVLAMAWLSADLRAGPALRARLSGGATVAVMAPRTAGDLESLDAAAWRAREILARTPGVVTAQVLTPAPGDQAIAAAMGAGGAPSRLIALVFVPGVTPAAPAMMAELARGGLRAAADDHNPISGPVARAVALDGIALAVAGAVLLGVLAGLTAAMVGERARRLAPRISLLSALGMTHSALMVRLTRPVVVSAGLGAIVGGAGALAMLTLAGTRLPGVSPLIPAPDATDLLIAAAWPVLALIVALLSASIIGLGRMRRIAP